MEFWVYHRFTFLGTYAMCHVQVSKFGTWIENNHVCLREHAVLLGVGTKK